MDLKCLASVTLVSELLGQCLNDITEAVLQSLVHLVEISLLVQGVLHFLHPLGKLVTQMGQLHLKVVNTTYESIKDLLADTTVSSRLRNLEVGESVLKAKELLFESSHTSLKVLVVLVLECFELSTKTFKLVPNRFSDRLNVLVDSSSLLISVTLHLHAESSQVLHSLQLVVMKVRLDHLYLLKDGISVEIS